MSDAAGPVVSPLYVDFAIEVGTSASRSFPVTVRSSAGEAKVTMAFPFNKAALEKRLLEVENAMLRSGGGRRIAPTERQQCVQDFGQALFEALLAGDARRLYYESQDDATQHGQRLRIKLRIDSPELAALPWEFLFDPRPADFVSLSSNTPIVRYIGLSQPIEPLRVKPPLLVLGMVAVPVELAQLDVAKEQRQIDQALQSMADDGMMRLTWMSGQTWRDLQREIRQDAFNVFHFIGHGHFDSDHDEGLIVLRDENGASYSLRATDLAMLLADEPSLRLVVLNACEGAQGGGRDIFASTASILVRRGVPAVLAMQYAITDEAAIAFARAFYEAVADGEPMEAAVAEGRKAVRLAIPGTLEWATPVLYQRATDGILFEPGKRTSGRTRRKKAAEDRPDGDAPATAINATKAIATAGASAVAPETGVPGHAAPATAPSIAAFPTIGKVIAGLIAAAVLLVMLLRLVNPTPATNGSILDAGISEPNVTLGKFCDARPGTAGCDGLSREQLNMPGNVFSVTVEAQGYAGKNLPLKWTIYSATTKQPVEYADPISGENTLREQPGWPADGYVPASNVSTDRNELDFWVPSPIEPGSYYVWWELYPDVGARLDSFATAPFTVT